MEQIFGVDVSTPVKFVIAFGVVLSLIAITFVGLRRLAGRRLPLSNSGRARQPRLGVLDAFAIDARRRLVLIRRDNVEHLIMIGGPNDVLVESEIVRAPAQAQLAPQRAQRAPGENTRAAVAPPERNVARALPPPEQAQAPIQQQQREPEPQPITPAAFRNAFPPRPTPRPAPPVADNPPPPPRAPARPQRMDAEHAAREAAPPAKPKAEIDPLYADIERKLGEALSRPASAPPTPPAPTRSAPPPPPPIRASAPPPPSARPAAPPPPPARPAAPPPPRRAPEPPAPKASRNHLDALEEEMASLLGRDRAT